MCPHQKIKREKNIKVRRITDENILKFKGELSNVSWEIVIGSDYTENAYNSFKIKFKALCDRSFRLVEKHCKRECKHWLTSGIRNVNIGLQVD